MGIESDNVQGNCPKCGTMRLLAGTPARKVCPRCDTGIAMGVDAPKSGLLNEVNDPGHEAILKEGIAATPQLDGTGKTKNTDSTEKQKDTAVEGATLFIPSHLLFKLYTLVDKERKKEKDLTKLQGIVNLQLELERRIK